MPARVRIDRLLVERGLFESRAKAQAAIAAGLVTADGIPVTKPSAEIAADAVLRAEPAHPWVSRGGVKLAAALDHLGIDLADRVCLDVGASTGGFTEVLLARGARRVYAVDVGRGQLHPRCADAPRSSRSRRPTSATRSGAARRAARLRRRRRQLHLAEAGPAGGARARRSARTSGALVKPQFETGRRHLKKGIVRDPAVHAEVCADIADFIRSLGWRCSPHSPPRSWAATATANSSSARGAASAAELTFL